MKRKDALPLIEKRIAETKWLTYEDINIEQRLFKRFRKAAKPKRFSLRDLGDEIIRLYHCQPVELVRPPESPDELMGQCEFFLTVGPTLAEGTQIPIYLTGLNGQGWVASEEWFPLFHIVAIASERN